MGSGIRPRAPRALSDGGVEGLAWHGGDEPRDRRGALVWAVDDPAAEADHAPGRDPFRRARRRLPRDVHRRLAGGVRTGMVWRPVVLFRLVRNWLPRSPVVAGVLFGGAVWAVSYVG